MLLRGVVTRTRRKRVACLLSPEIRSFSQHFSRCLRLLHARSSTVLWGIAVEEEEEEEEEEAVGVRAAWETSTPSPLVVRRSLAISHVGPSIHPHDHPPYLCLHTTNPINVQHSTRSSPQTHLHASRTLPYLTTPPTPPEIAGKKHHIKSKPNTPRGWRACSVQRDGYCGEISLACRTGPRAWSLSGAERVGCEGVPGKWVRIWFCRMEGLRLYARVRRGIFFCVFVG